MIVTDRFIFLHLHKSGGSFVNEFLVSCFPNSLSVGYHLPRKLIPAPYAQLPALGFVRNPWSYYVSWYAFQSKRPQPNALFRLLSADGTLDFDATLRNLLRLGSGSEQLPALMQALPPVYTNRGLNLPGHALEPLKDSGLGFYSFLYHHMYDHGTGLLHVGRMEFLRHDLPSLLTRVGQPISIPMRTYIEQQGPRNVSQHGEYSSYYNDDLRQLVAQKDAQLIERHGYRFGAPALTVAF